MQTYLAKYVYDWDFNGNKKPVAVVVGTKDGVSYAIASNQKDKNGELILKVVSKDKMKQIALGRIDNAKEKIPKFPNRYIGIPIDPIDDYEDGEWDNNYAEFKLAEVMGFTMEIMEERRKKYFKIND